MATMNISLPDAQARFVDRLVNKHGYGNRSELFRSLIRLIQHAPNLVAKADETLLYGSTAWWKKEIAEAKKEYAEGKGVVFSSYKELKAYLDTLKANVHDEDSTPAKSGKTRFLSSIRAFKKKQRTHSPA